MAHIWKRTDHFEDFKHRKDHMSHLSIPLPVAFLGIHWFHDHYCILRGHGDHLVPFVVLDCHYQSWCILHSSHHFGSQQGSFHHINHRQELIRVTEKVFNSHLFTQPGVFSNFWCNRVALVKHHLDRFFHQTYHRLIESSYIGPLCGIQNLLNIAPVHNPKDMLAFTYRKYECVSEHLCICEPVSNLCSYI